MSSMDTSPPPSLAPNASSAHTQDLQRQIEALRGNLEASQRANKRQVQELENRNRSLAEENRNLRMAKPPPMPPHWGHMPHAAPLPFPVHVGPTPPPPPPPQPQQPVTISVGGRSVGPPPPSPHAVGDIPPLTIPRSPAPLGQSGPASPGPEPPSYFATMDGSLSHHHHHHTNPPSASGTPLMPPSARERQLQQELTEKAALLDKYRAKTRHLALGIEPTLSAPVAPAGGPGAKAATVRQKASLGPRPAPATREGSSDRDKSPGERDEMERSGRRGPAVEALDVGIQNCAATCDVYIQTEEEAPQMASFTDPSGNVMDAILHGSRLCDAAGRLPTSRAINVQLFVSQAGPGLNGSFHGLPPALASHSAPLNFDGTVPPAHGGAATLPLTKGSSWSEEPVPLMTSNYSSSATLPAGFGGGSGVKTSSPKARGSGRNPTSTSGSTPLSSRVTSGEWDKSGEGGADNKQRTSRGPRNSRQGLN
jgi:hypothetical protein